MKFVRSIIGPIVRNLVAIVLSFGRGLEFPWRIGCDFDLTHDSMLHGRTEGQREYLSSIIPGQANVGGNAQHPGIWHGFPD